MWDPQVGGAPLPPKFDWDADNEEHLSRHDVASYEAEEAMTDPERVGFDVHEKGKKGIVGHTEDGRLLFVVYVVRDGMYRVITARDLNDGERHAFRRRSR
ncbi:MAG: BrnT family toxin [Bacilli bacterium]